MSLEWRLPPTNKCFVANKNQGATQASLVERHSLPTKHGQNLWDAHTRAFWVFVLPSNSLSSNWQDPCQEIRTNWWCN
jgi:hypothetical protein